MKLGDFAEHTAVLRGGWTEHRSQRRWQGALDMPVRGRALVLVEAGGAAFFAKTGASGRAPLRWTCCCTGRARMAACG